MAGAGMSNAYGRHAKVRLRHALKESGSEGCAIALWELRFVEAKLARDPGASVRGRPRRFHRGQALLPQALLPQVLFPLLGSKNAAPTGLCGDLANREQQ